MIAPSRSRRARCVRIGGRPPHDAPPHNLERKAKPELEPDIEAEDESLLHSLDTPDLDSLPRISTDELREKRKLAITQMQADRTAMRTPTYADPAVHDRGRPVLRLVHSVTAPLIEEQPPPPAESTVEPAADIKELPPPATQAIS